MLPCRVSFSPSVGCQVCRVDCSLLAGCLMQHTDVFTGRLEIKQIESKEGSDKNTDVLHFLHSETAKHSPEPLCFQLNISLSSLVNMHDLVWCVLKRSKPFNKQPCTESHIKGGYFWIHNGTSGWDHFKVMTCKVVFILKAFKWN